MVGGGGGNRTRVRRRTPRASPGAAHSSVYSAPAVIASVAAAGPSRLEVPSTPTTWVESSGSLVDASYRAESSPGLTDFVARSGGEGEVGALGIGTYWFTEGVNEITPRSRPASPSSTSDVETCHPLCSCHGAGPEATGDNDMAAPDIPAVAPARAAPSRTTRVSASMVWVRGHAGTWPAASRPPR